MRTNDTFSDLQNRVAAGVMQRFKNTMLCSTGIGATPQRAENPHFYDSRNEGFSRLWPQRHCLLLLYQIPDNVDSGCPVINIIQKKQEWNNGLGYTDFCKNAGFFPLKGQNVIPTFLPEIVGTVGLF